MPCPSGRTREAELSHVLLIVWVSSDVKTGLYVKFGFISAKHLLHDDA